MKGTIVKLFELALANSASFVFPLVFAIVCGRTLGIHGYGIVAFYTSMAGFLGIVIEFGLDWIGVREVAQNTENKAHGQSTLANIIAAKLLLWLLGVVVVGSALLATRSHEEFSLMVGAMAYLLGFACDASWYLRALERTRLLLAISAVMRLLGVGLILFFVRQPDDLAPAMWCYSAVALGTSAVSWFSLRHESFAMVAEVKWRRIVALYRSAWAIVIGNLSGSTLTNGGVTLLGILADPATVGAANLALRLRMAGQAVMLPILQLGYVRVSANARASPRQAVRTGRFMLGAMLGVSVLVALALMLCADAIVLAVFREPQPVASGLIMMLGLSIPINSAAQVFGMQSLIAFGFERTYAVVVSVASVVFCAMLFGLASSPFGYGWSVLTAELVASVACGLALRAALTERGAT